MTAHSLDRKSTKIQLRRDRKPSWDFETFARVIEMVWENIFIYPKWKPLPFLAASVPQLHMNTKISSFRIVKLLAKWEIHMFYSVKEIQN